MMMLLDGGSDTCGKWIQQGRMREGGAFCKRLLGLDTGIQAGLLMRKCRPASDPVAATA
jgi:hypothetical protein